MRVGVASDHAGLALKEELVEGLKQKGYQVEDLGTHDHVSVDYPDYAAILARAIQQGAVERGILLCGTGIGMSIVANKHRGIRAALCSTEFEARMTRAHNDANVLCMGERVVGPGLGRAIAEVFLSTPFEGGRHERRLKKIAEVEAGQVWAKD